MSLLLENHVQLCTVGPYQNEWTFYFTVTLRIWVILLLESGKENGKEEEEIKCKIEIQYLFNIHIFTKMMVKQNQTFWITEGLTGYIIVYVKHISHVPLTYGYAVFQQKRYISQVSHKRLTV